MFHGGVYFHNQSQFYENYKCYSSQLKTDRENVTYGGKIILPPSALARLSMLSIDYPMLFALKNNATGSRTHSGVLEFIAEEGRVYVPLWMMNTLLVNEGDIISVTSISLPLGKFVKIQPQNVDFLEISDPYGRHIRFFA